MPLFLTVVFNMHFVDFDVNSRKVQHDIDGRLLYQPHTWPLVRVV